MIDQYNLHRFLDAQADVFDDAFAILQRGATCSDHMDIIFPRLALDADLQSPYALGSLDEASAYLDYPVLGDRYRLCVEALIRAVDCAAGDVFGAEDAAKLQASLTLFAEATNELLFRSALSVWFDDLVDEQTKIRLGQFTP